MREENNALRPRAKTFNKPKQRVMKNENNLFAEFKPSTYEEWKEASEKLLKGAPFDKKMYSKTPEGIVLRPIYNKEDINIAENMFIDLLSGEIKERQTLNRQSLYFKKQERNFFLLSKWSNPKHRCQPECSLKFLLPEVVVYFSDTDEIKVAKKLRSL